MLSRKEEQQKGIYIIVSVTQKLLVCCIQMGQYNNNRNLILSFNFGSKMILHDASCPLPFLGYYSHLRQGEIFLQE